MRRKSPRRSGAPHRLAFWLLGAFIGLGAAVLPGSARAQSAHSIQFDGLNDYVTFGVASALGTPTFTIEVRFKRTAPGTTTSTGVGGLTATPLIAKGRGEADGSTVDANYFLGIDGASHLCADYEEGTGQANPGQNHPVTGTTAITDNVWHHGAATFDGTAFRLYLDGNLEATLLVGSGRLPQSASIQHASLGSALNSTGVADGFFHGLLDEARIWSVARSQSQIQSAMGAEVLSGSGLLGRWGLSEGTGANAGNSIAGSPNGTLTNGPVWSTDAPISLSAEAGLRLGGTNAYVTFGDPSALRLGQFTLETWFRRDGAGVSTSTGTGGISNIVPLIAKGRDEGEGSLIDLNYILGIRASDNVLAADFEEGSAGGSPSANHPVFGVTPIMNGVWYHAAATYDGTTWKLYLDGALEAQSTVGQPPDASSSQRASLGSALNSTGVAAGFFKGALDEARIWNAARSQAQIQASMNSEITGATSGLMARWGLNEDAETAVLGSAGTTVNGTITGSDWSWAAGSTFDAPGPGAPAMPTGVNAESFAEAQITITWNDVANNESTYEIERSTTGSGGPFNLVHTSAANSTSWVDGSVTDNQTYCYRVRAVNGTGPSGYGGPSCATAMGAPNHALGSQADAYVDFGSPAALQLSQFTLELWMRRDWDGDPTTTGTGGLSDGVPLIAKGRDEGDAAAVDVNYFLGLRRSNYTLCADVEEGAGGASPGANHPVYGTTTIGIGPWNHAALTYDGSALRLYLNGVLEGSVTINQPIAAASTSPVALMSALNSLHAPQGNFVGMVDEVRIWNVARSQAQIKSTMNSRITSAQTGLVARWALDENTGTTVNGSAGTSITGSVGGAYYYWNDGAPFTAVADRPPLDPTVTAPANGAGGVSTSPTLSVNVSDPESGPVTVTWYGRSYAPWAGADFTLVGLPDTQYYTGELYGGVSGMLQSQTNWVVANLAASNIAYVAHYGDCVENGDNNGDPIEWMRADTAFAFIENPSTTGLPEGVPYGIAVGNHDQSPNGDANGTTNFYNQYFGTGRFSGRQYYGGHYGVNNDDWYDLFSADGMDFIILSPEYDTSPDPAVLSWMDNLLTTYANRRAIVVTHYITDTGNPSAFSLQGKAIWDALKGHPNLFLMLGGHIDGQGRRQDTFGGNTVFSFLTNFQFHDNGGDGWMRIMQFSPANNAIHVRTYSPWLNQYMVTADSLNQFTVSYDLTPGYPFHAIGSTSGVPSGSLASLPWTGLQNGTDYEWYVTVDDGTSITRSSFWRFTTAGATGVGDELAGLSLAPIMPNPMRGHGTIGFTLPRESHVRVTVIDLQGRLVAVLADGVRAAGRHSIAWDGSGRAGPLATGVYFVRLDTPGRSFVRRAVLMR